MPDVQGHPAAAETPNAVARAEALLDRLAGRLRDIPPAVRQSVSSEVPDQAVTGETRPAADRAADLVDTAARRAGALSEAAGKYIRKTAALAREEAEDILADAQALRHRTA